MLYSYLPSLVIVEVIFLFCKPQDLSSNPVQNHFFLLLFFAVFNPSCFFFLPLLPFIICFISLLSLPPFVLVFLPICILFFVFFLLCFLLLFFVFLLFFLLFLWCTIPLDFFFSHWWISFSIQYRLIFLQVISSSGNLFCNI